MKGFGIGVGVGSLVAVEVDDDDVMDWRTYLLLMVSLGFSTP